MCMHAGRTLPLIAFAMAITAFGGCEKKADSVVDSVGLPPVLLQTSINPSSINSDSIIVGGTRSAEDLLTLSAAISARASASSDNPITHVRFSLISPSSNQVIADGELFDNGEGVDGTKGDGLFALKAVFQIKRVEIGVFKAEIYAEGQNGFQSNTAVVTLTIFRGNHIPLLSDLVAPDTLTLGSESQFLTLRIKATDPDGQSDIVRVIFNSYKPDGAPSSGNPFQMYDDGVASHGDVAAGDGTYSLIITLPSTTPAGTYKFEFQAFDRSNEASATVIHRVTVKQ